MTKALRADIAPRLMSAPVAQIPANAAASNGWGEEMRATFMLALPLVLTGLAQMAIYSTDVLMIGWLGSQELAASALGVSLFSTLMLTGQGIAMAAAPMIASAIGAKTHSVREVRRSVRMALWGSVLYVLPCWILLWNAEWVMHLLGQDPAIAKEAARYVHYLQWGMLPVLGIVVLRNFVAALNRPNWALWVAIAGIGINAVANYGLIFGHFGLPAMGVAGAGLASTLTSTAMFGILAAVVVWQRRFRRFHIFGRFFRWDGERLAELFRLGTPIALTLLFEVSVFGAAVFLMGLIGKTSIAAHAIALQLASFAFMVPLGIAQATTIRVGMAYGAKDDRWVTLAGWSSFALAMGFAVFSAIIFWLFPSQLIQLFLKPDDPDFAEVLALGISFLGIAALFQLADGAQVVGAAMLRGLHDTRVPMIFALVGYWLVGMGSGAFLAFKAGWEGDGVWTGLAVGLTAVAILMLWRWMGRKRLGLLPG